MLTIATPYSHLCRIAIKYVDYGGSTLAASKGHRLLFASCSFLRDSDWQKGCAEKAVKPREVGCYVLYTP
jgi:hypothetical protein